MVWLDIVLRRLLWFVPTLLGLLAIVFILSRVVPIDPARLVAGDNASPAQVEALRASLGLDQPLPVQFMRYVGDVAQGRFGTSLFSQQPIAADLAGRLPATMELTLVAVLLAGLVGVPLGVLCGVHRNSWIDHGLRIVTVSGLAVASFWFAMQLQFLFSMKLRWLPLSGRINGFPPEDVTGLMIVDALIEGDPAIIASAASHIVLPALTLALPAAATVVRFTRSGVIGALSSASVAYQTAMGYPRRLIIWKYVLRMAISATVTQLGLIFGILLAGAVVVETVFDWPGIGAYAVRSILQNDYNAVMGFTLWTGAIFVGINLLVDLLHAAIDPRGAR